MDATTRYVWTPFYSTYQLRWTVTKDGTTGFWKVQGLDVYEGAVLEQAISTVASVWEYVYRIAPNGHEDNYDWTGSGHGGESLSLQTWKDQDGNTLTVDAVTTTATAEQVILTQEGTSIHVDTGGTPLANFQCATTWTDQGMQIYHKHDWLTGVNVGSPSYAAMFAADDAETTSGHFAGDADVTLDLTNNDDSSNGNTPAYMACMWSAAHKWVPWIYITEDDGMLNWQYSDRVRITDDSSTPYNKVYMQCVGARTAHVDLGDTWETTTLYRVSYVDDPATTIVPI